VAAAFHAFGVLRNVDRINLNERFKEANTIWQPVNGARSITYMALTGVE
jgi:hypothetical protein